MAKTRIYSVGHSNHPLARLVQLLQSAGATMVVDVRSQPYSQRLPHFNRPELEAGLESCGIAYAFFGKYLGGRPANPQLYDHEGRVDYERMRATRIFQEGLDHVCQVLDEFRVAMLCSEEDPLDCHRGLLIAPALVERGIQPAHLRGDGAIESTSEFEDRLLRETEAGAGMLDGLFATLMSGEERRQLLTDAYRRQARRKAFRLRPGDTQFSGTENRAEYPGD
jgi:uncharacterized protein (DUF488 family)